MKQLKNVILIILTAIICFCFSSFAYAQSASIRYLDGVMTISGLDDTALLIHTSYNNGTLENAEMKDVLNGNLNIAAQNGDKFFLWQSISAMIPLCGIITVGENTELEPIPTPIPTPTPEPGKTLVVYYSATGTTERVANYIAAATKADIFELEPINPYTSADLNYSDSSSRVVYEHEHPEAQDVELTNTTIPDWSSYDTVFIGYPIWWHAAAWPVNRFITENDFTGKTVIPFSTSASSGEIGGDALAEMAGTGDWQTGRGFLSSETRNETLIKTWVDNLGI